MRVSFFQETTCYTISITSCDVNCYIMSLAFSGLLFSTKLLLNQMGLLLVTSVLLDTFVVRTILVPALMLAADGWNW